MLFFHKNKVLDWTSYFRLRATLSRCASPPPVPSQGAAGAPLKLWEPHSQAACTEQVGLERMAPFLSVGSSSLALLQVVQDRACLFFTPAVNTFTASEKGVSLEPELNRGGAVSFRIYVLLSLPVH